MTMERSGKCLCGGVTFTVTDPELKLSACHCDMCRRWGSGGYYSVGAPNIEWTKGEDLIKTFTSSDWAERAFCSECGTNLYYRVTAQGPHHGAVHISFGTLDDWTGFELEREWFIDRKPDSYALEGDQKKVTEAEVMAMFGDG